MHEENDCGVIYYQTTIWINGDPYNTSMTEIIINYSNILIICNNINTFDAESRATTGSGQSISKQ